MSVWHCLALVRPLDPATGDRVDIRVASASLREITGLGGTVWEPAMSQAPALAIDLFNGDFVAAVTAGAAALPLAMQVVKESWPDADAYAWAGAEVTIYAGRIGDAWPWDAVFVGRVETYQRKGQTLTLACSVDLEPFKVDVLTAEYAGTGGAEGGADLKNKVKPLVIGRARNVEPVLISATDSVYQFSGYGPIEDVTELFERGSSFGAADSDYSDYAALVAATVPPGAWATCLAEGLVRLGAPAYGVITGDVMGHAIGGSTPRLTGAIIAALADIAGIDAALLESASLDAMDAAVPYTVNNVLTEQASFLDVVQAMALPCNYQAGVSLTGKAFVARVDLGGSEAFTLDAQGKALPQVSESSEETTSPPFWKTVMGADRCWRVHSLDEIAFYAPLIDMGLWSATTVYREGNIVHLADDTQWLYINTTPTAGNAPTAGSLYWASLTGDTGIYTERWPADPPTDWPIGSIYYGEDNHPYRFEGLELYCGEDQLFCGEEPLTGSGYVSVRDRSLSEIITALEAVDDDNVLTIDEKVRIVIPESARLESQYQGALARANLLGLNVSTMTDARSAWIALRDSLSPAWNNTSQNTPITRTDWDTILDTYRTAIEDANTAIASPGAVTVFPPATQVVQRDQSGTALAGEFPRTLTSMVKRGDTDITGDDDVSYSIAAANVTATIDDTDGSATKGEITVIASSADGYIDLSVVVGAVTYGPYRIAFTTKAESLSISYEDASSIVFHFQSGGLTVIEQMGKGSIGPNSTLHIDYPEAYTTKSFGTASGGSSDPAREGDVHAYADDLTGIDIINTQGVTCFYSWRAIGY